LNQQEFEKVMREQIRIKTNRNIANELFVTIRQLIIGNEIPSNFAFPNENRLCAQLGVGRTTLREAYKALESSGFITRTKRGTVVNGRDKIAEKIPFAMTIEMSDYTELMEFRSMLEAELAYLAAIRTTEENIANLKEMLTKMEAHTDDFRALTLYDTKFHYEIAVATHNHLLINTMSMSIESFFKGVYKAFQIDTKQNIQQALSRHHEILDAIEKRDPIAAQRAMRTHVNEIMIRSTHR
jgi:GntR family transcriptional repressor for pyruvate dehydrogenase complex